MNKNPFPHLMIILGLVLALAACQPRMIPPAGAITPVPMESQTPATAPVETPFLSPTAPPLSETAPMDTLPAPTTLPSPTADLAAAVMAASSPVVKESATSPDGRWRAEAVRYECVRTSEEQETAYEVLRLVDLDAKAEKTIAEQIQYCGGLGAAGLGQISWSDNSRYLYFSDAAEGVPDGLCDEWQRPLTAYDPASGETFSLAQGPRSPKQPLIAFWQVEREPRESHLVLWDLEKGETGRFPVVEPEWFNGPIAWSPDGAKLAYLQTQTNCVPGGETVIALADISNGNDTLLVRSKEQGFTGIEWIQPENIFFYNDKGQAWMYDLSKGELTPGQ